MKKILQHDALAIAFMVVIAAIGILLFGNLP
jgi:hypothetical protein